MIKPGLLISARQIFCRGLGSYASVRKGVAVNTNAKTMPLKLSIFNLLRTQGRAQ